MSPHSSSALLDEAVSGVLERLYDDVVRVDPEEREKAKAMGLVDDHEPGFYQGMSGAYMPVTPEFGKLLYVLARGANARNIVEFGTSFGISTIFLAAALRDSGGGQLITTELIAEKAERARQNVRDAGLEEFVEFRIGDGRLALSGSLPDPVDLLLLDGPKLLYLDVLKQLEHTLRPGSLVASDNTDMQGAGEYRDYVRAAANGYVVAAFTTSALNSSFGHEVAVRTVSRESSFQRR